MATPFQKLWKHSLIFLKFRFDKWHLDFKIWQLKDYFDNRFQDNGQISNFLFKKTSGPPSPLPFCFNDASVNPMRQPSKLNYEKFYAINQLIRTWPTTLKNTLIRPKIGLENNLKRYSYRFELSNCLWCWSTLLQKRGFPFVASLHFCRGVQTDHFSVPPVRFTPILLPLPLISLRVSLHAKSVALLSLPPNAYAITPPLTLYFKRFSYGLSWLVDHVNIPLLIGHPFQYSPW